MSFGPKLEYISLMHLQKDDMRDDLNDKNITVSG